MKMLRPEVGKWYKDMQVSALFEVVAWDIQAHTIETQHLDGEIAEYDLDTWREMLLESVEAPEDWRTAFELDDEDLIDPDLPYHPEDWRNPLSFIEPEFIHGLDDI
ncbi:MAG: hypothetical protein IMF06_13795 [Proteobacteria bacterium]|nr:hypothetical protein [Pseudomonadota bacterium]